MTVEWISIEGRLPENGQTVLAWVAKAGISVARYRESGKIWSTVPGAWGIYPTHWAELPEGPKQ